jgi:hypothetical protein
MVTRQFGSKCVVIAALFAAVACSPDSVEGPNELTPQLGHSPQGFYDLSFQTYSGVVVTSLPFGNGVVLKASVTDAARLPAQAGTVTFQYCSLKGRPTGDVTRIDEAPASACASGAARWRNLGSARVDLNGSAVYTFPEVNFTPAIGFRFKFSEQNSGIGSGVSPATDFFWY